MKSSRSLNKLFEEAHDNLANLITRTRQLRHLTLSFRTILDNKLAPHCYISNIEGQMLSVYVDSAAWATQLRFQTSQLLPQLQRANPAFANVSNIRISIVAQRQIPEAPPREATGPVLSRDNANIINALSNSIDDQSLQQALRRLARHACNK